MQKLKDYNLHTVRYTIEIVAALFKDDNYPADWRLYSLLDKNISDIIDNENLSVEINEVSNESMLPEGWSTNCLPYLEEPDDAPEHINDATIKHFLNNTEYDSRVLARISELEEEIKNLKQKLNS